MKKNYLRIAGLVAVMGIAVPMLAHHQFSAEFDRNKPMTVQGSIKSVDWSEPHVSFTLNVTSGGPAGDWKMEGASPATLSRHNWTQSMLKMGDTVTVDSYQALDGSRNASARSVRLPDGRNVSISDSAEDGGPAAQLTSPSELPSTASNLPVVVFLGGLALLGAFAVRVVRS